MKGLDGIESLIATFSTKAGNSFAAFNENISNSFGYERAVVLKENQIVIQYKPTGHTANHSADESFYVNGQLYIQDYANPVQLKPSEMASKAEPDVVASERYKQAVQQRVIRQALNTPTDEYDLSEKLLMGLIGMVAMGIVAVVYLMQTGAI